MTGARRQEWSLRPETTRRACLQASWAGDESEGTNASAGSNVGISEPIELVWGTIEIRGYRWAGDANVVVLLHDVEADLDAWADVPLVLAADGYSVIAVDLPGHGISDDPWEPERAMELVTFLADAVKPPATRCFVVAAGQLCGPALVAPGVDALVAVSPKAVAHAPDHPTPPVCIIVGGADEEASSVANGFFRHTRGWTVLSSFGTTAQSTRLYSSEWGAHAVEQTLMFLRDYRS